MSLSLIRFEDVIMHTIQEGLPITKLVMYSSNGYIVYNVTDGHIARPPIIVLNSDEKAYIHYSLSHKIQYSKNN